MNRKHLDVQFHGGGDGLGNRVRDVMKFQIEKYRGAGASNEADNVGAGAGEKLAADFEPAHERRDLLDQVQRQFSRGHIQRGNDWVSHRKEYPDLRAGTKAEKFGPGLQSRDRAEKSLRRIRGLEIGKIKGPVCGSDVGE